MVQRFVAAARLRLGLEKCLCGQKAVAALFGMAVCRECACKTIIHSDPGDHDLVGIALRRIQIRNRVREITGFSNWREAD